MTPSPYKVARTMCERIIAVSLCYYFDRIRERKISAPALNRPSPDESELPSISGACTVGLAKSAPCANTTRTRTDRPKGAKLAKRDRMQSPLSLQHCHLG